MLSQQNILESVWGKHMFAWLVELPENANWVIMDYLAAISIYCSGILLEYQ